MPTRKNSISSALTLTAPSRQRCGIIFSFKKVRTRIVSINYYDTQAKCARQVSIQDFDNQDMTILRHRYDALQMQWIQAEGDEVQKGNWVLLNGTTRSFIDSTQTLASFDSLKVGKLLLTPADIEKKQRTPDEMDYSDLRSLLKTKNVQGKMLHGG